MSQPEQEHPTDETGRDTTPVSEEEVAAAMGVSSVPDEVRSSSTDPDETGLVIDGSGELRPPAEEEPEGSQPSAASTSSE